MDESHIVLFAVSYKVLLSSRVIYSCSNSPTMEFSSSKLFESSVMHKLCCSRVIVTPIPISMSCIYCPSCIFGIMQKALNAAKTIVLFSLTLSILPTLSIKVLSILQINKFTYLRKERPCTVSDSVPSTHLCSRDNVADCEEPGAPLHKHHIHTLHHIQTQTASLLVKDKDYLIQKK